MVVGAEGQKGRRESRRAGFPESQDERRFPKGRSGHWLCGAEGGGELRDQVAEGDVSDIQQAASACRSGHRRSEGTRKDRWGHACAHRGTDGMHTDNWRVCGWTGVDGQAPGRVNGHRMGVWLQERVPWCAQDVCSDKRRWGMHGCVFAGARWTCTWMTDTYTDGQTHGRVHRCVDVMAPATENTAHFLAHKLRAPLPHTTPPAVYTALRVPSAPLRLLQIPVRKSLPQGGRL